MNNIQNDNEKRFPETNAMEEELNTPETDESDEDELDHLDQLLDSDLDILSMILDFTQEELHDAEPDTEKIDRRLSAIESLLDGLKEPLEQISEVNEKLASTAPQTVVSFYPLQEEELKQLIQN